MDGPHKAGHDERRSGGRLHARRQVGEAATAGDDVVELAELLVAPMVATSAMSLRAMSSCLRASSLSAPLRRRRAGRAAAGSARRGRSAARTPPFARARVARARARCRRDKAASVPARRSPPLPRGRALRLPSRRPRGERLRGRKAPETGDIVARFTQALDGLGSLTTGACASTPMKSSQRGRQTLSATGQVRPDRASKRQARCRDGPEIRRPFDGSSRAITRFRRSPP